MEFDRTISCVNLTNKIKNLQDERIMVDNEIMTLQIRLNGLESRKQQNSTNSLFERDHSNCLKRISHFEEKRNNLYRQIEETNIQLIEERVKFEEEQKRKKEESDRLSTEQFINFTNTLSDKEIEEFQERYEKDEKEKRYLKYKSLREKTPNI